MSIAFSSLASYAPRPGRFPLPLPTQPTPVPNQPTPIPNDTPPAKILTWSF
jgi:hypothetical protein